MRMIRHDGEWGHRKFVMGLMGLFIFIFKRIESDMLTIESEMLTVEMDLFLF